ncbi:MAG TPA: NAD(P)-dependent alcohol dehydrogenase [Actinomycetota bacterium]|nr:NAD(P)-dependent alcohol dehydrogenase [Actinomycetota bacterium]
MQAVVQDSYGSPDVLELREIDKPAPTDDEVLVRVHAAGVDPGVWHLMTGRPYLVRVLGYGVRTPKVRIRGRDVAGRMEAVGNNVTRFHPGEEVFGIGEGSFAEYVRARQDKLAPKPANLSFEQAAAVPISALTALQALRDTGQIQPGQKTLIVGAAGGVGSFAVQLAKAFGAQVTGVCSTTKVELVRSIGADQVIDYTREDFADGSRSWDLIVDTAGRRSLSQLRWALTRRGTLVIVGGEGGGRWLGGFDRQILRAPAVSAFSRQRLRPFTSKERRADLLVLKELIEAGKVTPVIDRTYPLAEAPEAIRYLEKGHARGKIVIRV